MSRVLEALHELILAQLSVAIEIQLGNWITHDGDKLQKREEEHEERCRRHG